MTAPATPKPSSPVPVAEKWSLQPSSTNLVRIQDSLGPLHVSKIEKSAAANIVHAHNESIFVVPVAEGQTDEEIANKAACELALFTDSDIDRCYEVILAAIKESKQSGQTDEGLWTAKTVAALLYDPKTLREIPTGLKGIADAHNATIKQAEAVKDAKISALITQRDEARRDAIRYLQERNAALLRLEPEPREAVKEKEKDTERLDYLDRYTETWREVPGIVAYLKGTDKPKNLRSAIDAAMQGGNEKERKFDLRVEDGGLWSSPKSLGEPGGTIT